MKKALITGVTGQDGSYLAELLLEKGYKVYGLQRRSSNPNTARIDHLYDNPRYPRFYTIYGDMSDGSVLARIIDEVGPDEIYNLAAQSHVQISYELPEYTADVTGLGALRILETLRKLKAGTRYYQASSSEMFGRVLETPQKETTPFNPLSPYAASKVLAFYATRIYRESYKLFAANGILFNHESPRRGENFVSRKITLGLAKIKVGLADKLQLGNLDSQRDWGFSKDYVGAMYKILHHKRADDFVIATGETHSIREFAEKAGAVLGMNIVWKGKKLAEKGIDKKTGKIVIEVDPKFFRPNEVAFLKGDYSKAKRILGWKPKTTFAGLVELMANADYDLVRKMAKAAEV